MRHNVFFSRDYRAEFDDIFARRACRAARRSISARRIARRRRAPRSRTPRSASSASSMLHASSGPPPHQCGDHLMRGNRTSECWGDGPENRSGTRARTGDDSGGFRRPLPVDRRGALWPGDARLASSFARPGAQEPDAGPLSGGRQRPSGPGAPMAALSGRQAAMLMLDLASTGSSSLVAMPGGMSTR